MPPGKDLLSRFSTRPSPVYHDSNLIRFFAGAQPSARWKNFRRAERVVLPKGFIFHLSRCGSTLVAQMLAALPQNVVLSEAPPIDAMLRADVCRPTVTDAEKITWLQWMLGALGQKLYAEAEHLFIKFDAWNTLDLALIARAFPAVPWIFLYRHPLEILVSQQRARGMVTLPDLIRHRAIHSQSILPDEYAAYILNRNT